MLQRLNLGVIVAVITGGVFGAVTAIEGNIARSVGAINASLLEHSIAGLIAIPAVLIAFGITALVLFFVLPAIGIILTSTLLIVALVVGAVFALLPILLLLKPFAE